MHHERGGGGGSKGVGRAAAAGRAVADVALHAADVAVVGGVPD